MPVELIVFGLIVPVFVVLVFGQIALSVLSARRFAADNHDGIVRILGACRSRSWGIRSGFPVVVVEIGSHTSRFVTFVGRRTQIEVVPTDELKLEWMLTRLVFVEHPGSGTKLWPRWNPNRPADYLAAGKSDVCSTRRHRS